MICSIRRLLFFWGCFRKDRVKKNRRKNGPLRDEIHINFFSSFVFLTISRKRWKIYPVMNFLWSCLTFIYRHRITLLRFSYHLMSHAICESHNAIFIICAACDFHMWYTTFLTSHAVCVYLSRNTRYSRYMRHAIFL